MEAEEGAGVLAAATPSSSPPNGSCFTGLTDGGGENSAGVTKGEAEEEEKGVWWWWGRWRGGEGKGLPARGGDPGPLPDATIIRFLVPPLNIACHRHKIETET